MQKDDYFVIVYRILTYLYACLKAGEDIDKDVLSPSGLGIRPKYWAYIMENLQEDKYIKGIRVLKNAASTRIDNIEITPQGIAYLIENKSIQKAKNFWKNEQYATVISGI